MCENAPGSLVYDSTLAAPFNLRRAELEYNISKRPPSSTILQLDRLTAVI